MSVTEKDEADRGSEARYDTELAKYQVKRPIPGLPLWVWLVAGLTILVYASFLGVNTLLPSVRYPRECAADMPGGRMLFPCRPQ